MNIVYVIVEGNVHASRSHLTVRDWGTIPQPGDRLSLMDGEYVVREREFVSDRTGDRVELICDKKEAS